MNVKWETCPEIIYQVKKNYFLRFVAAFPIFKNECVQYYFNMSTKKISIR